MNFTFSHINISNKLHIFAQLGSLNKMGFIYYYMSYQSFMYQIWYSTSFYILPKFSINCFFFPVYSSICSSCCLRGNDLIYTLSIIKKRGVLKCATLKMYFLQISFLPVKSCDFTVTLSLFQVALSTKDAFVYLYKDALCRQKKVITTGSIIKTPSLCLTVAYCNEQKRNRKTL